MDSTSVFLGFAYALAGRAEEARPLLDRPLATIEAAEAYVLLGQHEAAARLGRQILTQARQRAERPTEGWALRLLGDLAALEPADDPAAAETRYREALALAEELGMRPLQAHCYLGLGKLYRRMGQPAEARAELATAVGLLRAMEMNFWLPEVEAALASVC